MAVESRVILTQVRRLLSAAREFSGKLRSLTPETVPPGAVQQDAVDMLCVDFEEIHTGLGQLEEMAVARAKRLEAAPCRSEMPVQPDSLLLDLRDLAREARMSNFRLEAILNNVMATILFFDPGGRVQMANAAAVAMLGFDPSEMDIDRLYAALSVQDEAGRAIPLEHMPASRALQGEMVSNQALTLNIPRRGVHYVIVSAMPLYIGSEFSGVVTVWNDITRQRQQEDERVEALTRLEVQRRLLEYRERERQDLGRDIHDGPIQSLASAMFHLQYIKEEAHDEQTRAALEQASRDLRSTVRELRGLVNELRPPSLIRFGVSKALRVYTEDFRDRHPEIEINMDVPEEQHTPSEDICLALYRIYQEGLNNVARHAEASQVWVRYASSAAGTELEIRDNGKGMPARPDMVKLAHKGHFGLVGMKERAEAVGGTFQTRSRANQGTTLQVRVPNPEKIKNKD